MKLQKRVRSIKGCIDHIEVYVNKTNLLNSAIINKGTAFSFSERKKFLLEGLLPFKVETINQQSIRLYKRFTNINKLLDRYYFLMDIYSSNVTLFFKFCSDYIEEVLPIIYTPTVGNAILQFNDNFFNPMGLFLSYSDKGNIQKILKQNYNENINFIIVTDGESVLGIGDQGVSSINISIGKLMVYVIFSGLDPDKILPIVLDLGTNNKDLLRNPLYLGSKINRVGANNYDSFIDEFVKGVQDTYQNVFLHWEDFGKDNAIRNLQRYKNEMCTFNDDIQGTGIVTAANILSAIEAQNLRLCDQKIVILGAGSASIGIADQILNLLCQADLSREEAEDKFWILNSKGLLTNLQDNLKDFQRPYVKNIRELKEWTYFNNKELDLDTVIENVKPTILIGVSTVFNAFGESIIRKMSSYSERPIIMPLSNPTNKCEAHPQDIINWSNGKAIIATGSPFGKVTYKYKIIEIAQGNNAYIFPGLGLGVIASKAKTISNGMIYIACRTLSSLSPFRKDQNSSLLPPIKEIKTVSKLIANQVALHAVKEGLADISVEEVKYHIESIQWEPKYYNYNFISDA